MNENNSFNAPREYKKRSSVKSIVLYGFSFLVCIICGLWKLSLIFLVLTVFYVFIHVRNKDKIDSNLLRQGMFQIKQNKKNKRDLEKERKQSFQDYLAKVDEEFDDKDIDVQLKLLEELEELEDEELDEDDDE